MRFETRSRSSPFTSGGLLRAPDLGVLKSRFHERVYLQFRKLPQAQGGAAQGALAVAGACAKSAFNEPERGRGLRPNFSIVTLM